MTTIARHRRHSGIALLRYGFRPFFLGAGLWAAVAIVIRIADVAGYGSGGFAFRDATLWHAHAFLFGYASAVVAGFALTAVPNWTGRLPISKITDVTIATPPIHTTTASTCSALASPMSSIIIADQQSAHSGKSPIRGC